MERRTCRFFCDVGTEGHLIWEIVEEALRRQGGGMPVLSICPRGSEEPILAFDIENRMIQHEFWDPEISFAFSRLERAGGQGKNCEGAAV